LLAEVTIEDVLKHFGKRLKDVRQNYHRFVEKGIKQGRHEDLQGGGLIRPACHARPERISNRKKCGAANENRGIRDRVCKARAGRSSGGDKAGLLGLKKEDRDPPESPEAPDGGRGKSDQRILGSGGFVERVISNSHRIEYPKIVRKIPLPELVGRISKFLKTEKDEVLFGNRKQLNCHARNLICFIAVKSPPAMQDPLSSQVPESRKSKALRVGRVRRKRHERAGMGYKFNEITDTLKIYPMKCLPREMRSLFLWGVACLTGVHPVTAGRCAEKRQETACQLRRNEGSPPLLNIPKPDYNLGINSSSHGAMTGRMLEKIEEILIKENPDYVLVYGDTNSTLVGALPTPAACKKRHTFSACLALQ